MYWPCLTTRSVSLTLATTCEVESSKYITCSRRRGLEEHEQHRGVLLGIFKKAKFWSLNTSKTLTTSKKNTYLEFAQKLHFPEKNFSFWSPIVYIYSTWAQATILVAGVCPWTSKLRSEFGLTSLGEQANCEKYLFYLVHRMSLHYNQASLISLLNFSSEKPRSEAKLRKPVPLK